jgi:hypothetical protein
MHRERKETDEKITQRCSSSMGIYLRLRCKGVSAPLNDLGLLFNNPTVILENFVLKIYSESVWPHPCPSPKERESLITV